MKRIILTVAVALHAVLASAQLVPIEGARITGANEIASGGTLTVKSGGTLVIEAGATFTAPPSIFGSGSALQVLRRNAANTAFEWATVSVGGGDLLAANNLSELTNAATARGNLGLVIGTHVQAYAANLTSWAALAPSAKQNVLPVVDSSTGMPAVYNDVGGIQVGFDSAATAADFRAATGTAAATASGMPIKLRFLGANNGADVLVAATGRSTLVDQAGTITGWRIRGDTSGSIVVSIERAVGAGSFAEISGTGDPTLSSATYATGTTTGWGSTTLAAGDSVRAVITGTPASLHDVEVLLSVTRN